MTSHHRQRTRTRPQMVARLQEVAMSLGRCFQDPTYDGHRCRDPTPDGQCFQDR